MTLAPGLWRRIAVVYTIAAIGGLGTAIGLVGCGPVSYVRDVSYGASDAVDRAKAVHADKYAPYWWTRATQYLHEAREVAGHADFEGAEQFARLAREAAIKATAQAVLAAKPPSPGSEAADAPPIAPARPPVPATPAKAAP